MILQSSNPYLGFALDVLPDIIYFACFCPIVKNCRQNIWSKDVSMASRGHLGLIFVFIDGNDGTLIQCIFAISSWLSDFLFCRYYGGLRHGGLVIVIIEHMPETRYRCQQHVRYRQHMLDAKQHACTCITISDEMHSHCMFFISAITNEHPQCHQPAITFKEKEEREV